MTGDFARYLTPDGRPLMPEHENAARPPQPRGERGRFASSGTGPRRPEAASEATGSLDVPELLRRLDEAEARDRDRAEALAQARLEVRPVSRAWPVAVAATVVIVAVLAALVALVALYLAHGGAL